MMIQRLTIFLTAAFTLLAGGQVEKSKRAEWEQSLGSEDFAARSEAMTEIWEEGVGALDFLQELIDGDDPELRARAKVTARKVKLGMTPETPEKVSDLVEQYFEASVQQRISIFNDLLAAGELDLLLRLPEFEKDPHVLLRLNSTISRILPQVVRNYLNEGQHARALEVLAQSTLFVHQLQHGHLLQEAGMLDEEIAKLSESSKPQDQVRHLVYLRVRGDAQELRNAAKELGDRETEVLASLNLGDDGPYLEWLLKSPNLSVSDQMYLRWVIAKQQGDRQAEKESFDRLTALSSGGGERMGARMSLFRMGHGDLVLENLDDDELEGKVGYLLAHDRYAEAQEMLGIPDEGGFDKWLAAYEEKAKEEVAVERRDYPELARLVQVIQFLEARGLRKKATRCALLLFDVVRPIDQLDASRYARAIYSDAPESALTAIAREVQEHDAEFETFLEMLPVAYSDSSLRLSEKLATLYPEMETRELLLLTMSFSSRRLLVAPALFQEARDAILLLFKAQNDQVEGLSGLPNLLAIRNREADLSLVLDALEEVGRPNYFLKASLAIDAGRIREGAEAYAKIEMETSLMKVKFLYKIGLATKKAGMPEGDDLLKKARLLSTGSAADLRSFAMEHLRYGDLEEAYRLLQKALLRTKNTGHSRDAGLRYAIFLELATQAVTLERWQAALAYRELAALDPDYASARVQAGVLALHLRFQILMARGAVAMGEGDIVSAVAAFSRAHEIIPSDAYLANDFFPLLRKLGLRELHNQLFAKTIRTCRDNILRYPADDNAYNNFAWMAARANRNLDEAEGYLMTALKLNPESAAYLDTLAEVHFARGDRDEALAWSQKSIRNAVLGSSSTRWELQGQNRRFRLGAFPAE